MTKRSIAVFLAVLMFSTVSSFTAFAGEWKQDNIGWWWQNDDGSYPVNQWQWIDGNNNGVAECYHFNAQGYLDVDTIVDGFRVNKKGEWIEPAPNFPDVYLPQLKSLRDDISDEQAFHIKGAEGNY